MALGANPINRSQRVSHRQLHKIEWIFLRIMLYLPKGLYVFPLDPGSLIGSACRVTCYVKGMADRHQMENHLDTEISPFFYWDALGSDWIVMSRQEF